MTALTIKITLSLKRPPLPQLKSGGNGSGDQQTSVPIPMRWKNINVLVIPQFPSKTGLRPTLLKQRKTMADDCYCIQINPHGEKSDSFSIGDKWILSARNLLRHLD
ncbi:hypothetical protein AVEN_220134-1 [Araneus ventricosus]|uniref:Uncharacterized protein n=1 Tax=Araneus ventricosus TaxID=182803 RepID=A0A4Y2EV09_ARAVE|nr:hypothetical protein AVEN_220134-1 [Araneus ventricosus]